MLVFSKCSSDGWKPLVRTRTLDAADLLTCLDTTLASDSDVLGDRASALGSARVLALFERDEASAHGHRHEIVLGIRLQATAKEIHERLNRRDAEASQLTFVRSQSCADPVVADGISVVSCDDF